MPGRCSNEPELTSIMTRALRALGTRIRRCADAGLLGGRSVRTVAWQFHAFSQGLASVELHGWFPDDPESTWRDALTAFVAGLATKPKRSRRT
jgi:hypothetical protein